MGVYRMPVFEKKTQNHIIADVFSRKQHLFGSCMLSFAGLSHFCLMLHIPNTGTDCGHLWAETGEEQNG